jgi:hypothetical protein
MNRPRRRGVITGFLSRNEVHVAIAQDKLTMTTSTLVLTDRPQPSSCPETSNQQAIEQRSLTGSTSQVENGRPVRRVDEVVAPTNLLRTRRASSTADRRPDD